MPSGARGLAVSIAMALLLAAALALLFQARFAAGDIYPEGSSLRSDQRGVKALYEGLALTRRVQVERNFRDLSSVDARNATVLLLSVPVADVLFESELRKSVVDVARRGARVVIAIDGRKKLVTTAGDWGFGTVLTEERLHFRPTQDDWQVLDADAGEGVHAMERRIGSGSVVLFWATSPFSNSGLLQDRNSALLSKLIGDSARIVFDEHHLGVAERIGVATLGRRYRLHGAVAALLLLACLFLWRNGSSLLPPAAPRRNVGIAGRDAAAGLANVLRMSVPPAQLIDTCIAEWSRAHRRGRTPDLPTPDTRDPVQAYNAIAAGLVSRGKR